MRGFRREVTQTSVLQNNLNLFCSESTEKEIFKFVFSMGNVLPQYPQRSWEVSAAGGCAITVLEILFIIVKLDTAASLQHSSRVTRFITCHWSSTIKGFSFPLSKGVLLWIEGNPCSETQKGSTKTGRLYKQHWGQLKVIVCILEVPRQTAMNHNHIIVHAVQTPKKRDFPWGFYSLIFDFFTYIHLSFWRPGLYKHQALKH